MPLAQHLRHLQGVDPLVEVDGADDMAPVRRIGDEGPGVRAGLGPSVQRSGRLVAPARGPLETTIAVDPLDLIEEQEESGERGSVVGLVEA